MNLALWKKSIRESRWLLVGAGLLIFTIHWLRVWISSFFSLNSLQKMLTYVPQVFEQLNSVPFAQMATPAGRIAVAYDDPIVLLLVSIWAIARGSDAVSGELNRGTMELVLAQPVRRVEVLATQASVTLIGAALLASAALLGTSVGLWTVTLEGTVAAKTFLPAALNLFSLGAFLAGLTTLISSAGDYRSRTIGIVGGIYAVSMILKVIGRLVPPWHLLSYASFFTPFEPQLLVSDSSRAWSWTITAADDTWQLGGLAFDSILISLGLLCYVVAAVIFSRRDLPAPL